MMTEATTPPEAPAISTAYGQLVQALQKQIQTEQEQVRQFVAQPPTSREVLEKETYKIVALYEISLLLINLGTTLSKGLQEAIDSKEAQKMEQDLLTLIGDLKTLWQNEVQKEVQDKASDLLDEITRKEQDIKQAIEKRQQEIQAYAQQVTARAQKAQAIKR